MAEDSHKWLKGLLWFGAIYHILLGLMGIFAKNAVVSIAKSFYNFNLTLDAQTYWILNPLAAYMLVFGLFMAVAATDPPKYKNVIYVVLALIVIRVVERVIFMLTSPSELINVVDPTRNWIDIILVIVYGALVFVSTKKIK